MNYKKALNNNDHTVEKGVKIFGMSLMAWILFLLVFVAVAAFMSPSIGVAIG